MKKNATHSKQRHSRQQWLTILENWQNSGQLPSEFCRDNSINLASFYQWRLKIHAGAKVNSNNPIAMFAEYRQSELATSCPLKINVTWDSTRGIQIRITGDWTWRQYGGEHGSL